MNYTKLTTDSSDMQSQSPVPGNIAAIQKLFPQVVSEGKIDFDALRQLLGDDVAKENELYGLQWHGKAEARRAALTPSLGTLRPCKEESKDWDTTKNLYIEGDNLEVLKLLQKSYVGKVKMIYIDPPYNTGKEFVYSDNYQNSIEHYKKLTEQEGKFAENVEKSGRYHTDWLNMMYPRLTLARDLMCDDGVIFISIDNNEVKNLKSICDEVFGETNFLTCVTRATGTPTGGGFDGIVNELDYVMIYAKNINYAFINGMPMTEEDASIYDLEDERGRYLIRSLRRTGGEDRREDRPTMFFPIKAPDGTEIYPMGPTGYESRWICSPAKVDELAKQRMLEWKKNKEGRWQVYQKFYLENRTKAPGNLWIDIEGNKKATRDIRDIFDSNKVFDFPKPIGFLKKCLIIGSDKDAIILDFFSGSATTAHAVMQLNAEDGGNRRFIMVQLPEPCKEESEAYKAGYKNICEIGKERIRRAGEKVKAEAGDKATDLDIGFRVFKLDRSNVIPWNTDSGQFIDQLTRQEEVGNLRPERSSDDLFFEVLLKQGIELTEETEIREIEEHQVYSLGYGQFYCCFDARIGEEAQELAAGIARWHEEQDPEGRNCVVYVRDSAFDGKKLTSLDSAADARKMSFCTTLEQSGIMQVKAF